MSSKQDAELVAAHRAGDRRAGELLVDRYYDKILNFCRRKAPTAAMDLTQQIFLSCFEGLDRLRDPEAFRAFLFGVASNSLRGHYRAKRRDLDMLDFGTVSSMDLDPTPSRLLVQREDERVLLEALRSIPLDYQIMLELFYWEGLRALDIAEALALPIGTVKSRIRRGRALLEAELGKISRSKQALDDTTTNFELWAKRLRGRQLGALAGE